MEANLDRLTRPEQCHTSAAGGGIHRRVTIRSEPLSLMANYSKIKRVEPPCNGSGRKLEYRRVGRHRRGKEKNREAEERSSRKAR